jgi:hypothetical protein
VDQPYVEIKAAPSLPLGIIKLKLISNAAIDKENKSVLTRVEFFIRIRSMRQATKATEEMYNKVKNNPFSDI